MARFFIDRPIFAWVIAIIIMIAGLLSFKMLPVAQYPTIAPPAVKILAMYPGASAKTLEDTVTQVIEQQMNGIDNLEYMYSTSDSSGRMEIDLTFTAGTDPDTARMQVQNKLQLATPKLPPAVQRQGLTVNKSAKNFLIMISFYAADGSMSPQDISDYVTSNVQDPISRVSGVGEFMLMGSQYAMRIWCNPERMQQFTLNPSDIISAISDQNAQVAGGQIGAAPQIAGQHINMTVNAANLLETAEQFENIILRTNPDGSSLYIKDVATVAVDAEQFNFSARFNGLPATTLAVRLAPGANALETVASIKAQLARLERFFPAGLEIDYPYDTTPFVKISMNEVYKTLAEAILLVFLVMYLFLQSFRSTIIPTIVVPVVLLGTLVILNMAGFILNTLTMFAMVLAIGLLVDDAIVVVENVERLIHKEKLSPKEAAKQTMKQISGALLGMTTVLTAVFIPMAFFGGATGAIYRQFSITIVSAMGLSLLMALILTPALCAAILRPHAHAPQEGIFGRYNRWFDRITMGYQRGVHKMIRRTARFVIILAAFLGVGAFLFTRLPTGFLPDEDQGILMVIVQLAPGSTYESTEKVLQKIERHFLEGERDSVENIMAVMGYSFAGSGQNNAMCFIRLRDWKERGDAELRVPAIMRRAYAAFSQIPEARAFPFAPPAVVELGIASGFDFILQDQAGHGHEALMQARNQILQAAGGRPDTLTGVRPNGLDDVNQYFLDIDYAKAKALKIPIGELSTTIQAYWGSTYINDFIDKGRTKRVYLQADKDFRMQADDFGRYYIRNAEGEMVPFSAFMSGHISMGSPRLERYNGVPAVEILGVASGGKSTGQAMSLMEELAEQLPEGFGYSWTGLSYQERLSGSQAPALYALSLLIVFLCLAALYESWSIPFSVMLVVPIGMFGALLGATLRGMNNDVYFQVALLTTIGLSAKNAILIVEFARENVRSGMDVIKATLHAARVRLRPIVMTSMAFLLGVFPLVISTGAGSGSQNAIGTGVAAGVLAATSLGIYYTPVFFVLITRLFRPKADRQRAGEYDTSANGS